MFQPEEQSIDPELREYVYAVVVQPKTGRMIPKYEEIIKYQYLCVLKMRLRLYQKKKYLNPEWIYMEKRQNPTWRQREKRQKETIFTRT